MGGNEDSLPVVRVGGAVDKEIPDLASLDNDIRLLSQEVESISIETVPLDRWDCVAMFAVGLLEVAADFCLGDPQAGLSKAMSDENSRLGHHFSRIHDELSHTAHPLDYQGPGFGGTDHRARTFAHDLFTLPLSIYMLAKGEFVDFRYVECAPQWIISRLNQNGMPYASMPPDQAALAAIIHMVADFFAAKSLPVPGFGILAHVPVRSIRKLVADMYAEGFNLRHVMVQGLGPLACEVALRVYHWIRLRGTPFSKEARKHKLNKMLLLTHGAATCVNLGKVIILQNPCLLNLPMIVRTLTLTYPVITEEMEIAHRAKTKAQMAVLRTKLQTLRTAVLLEDAICYAATADQILHSQDEEIRLLVEQTEANRQRGSARLRNTLEAWRVLNRSPEEEHQ